MSRTKHAVNNDAKITGVGSRSSGVVRKLLAGGPTFKTAKEVWDVLWSAWVVQETNHPKSQILSIHINPCPETPNLRHYEGRIIILHMD